MSGYFSELALSIDEMLGGGAPAVEAGITDKLSETEEIRRRAYAATVAAWGSPQRNRASKMLRQAFRLNTGWPLQLKRKRQRLWP
jgi:hypothetical protein